MQLVALEARTPHSHNETQFFPSEKPQWYHLPGTGFDVRKQVAQLQSDIQFGFQKGINYEKTIESWFTKIRGDVYGFSLEYLKGQAFLPFEQVIEPYNGTNRVKPANYGDKPMVDLIDLQERNGAVKKGLLEVEKFLLGAPVGALVVRTSPPGRTNLYYQTEDGLKEVIYQDTQTQIYEKVSATKIRSYTIRAEKQHMGVDKNQQLLEFLGVSQMGLNQWQTENERLALISGINAYLLPGQTTVEQIIEKMRDLTGDRAFGGVSFDRVIWGLQHFDEIMQIDELTLKHTAEFINKAREILTGYYGEVIRNHGLAYELIDQIEFELGKAILDLSNDSEKILSDEPAYSAPTYTDTFATQINYVNHTSPPEYFSQATIAMYPRQDHYEQSLTKLQTKPGCAGGGASSTQTESPIFSKPTISGPRAITLEDPLNMNSHEKGACNDCGKESDGHYHCPGCNGEYADETNVAPENRTTICERINPKTKKKCGFEFGC